MTAVSVRRTRDAVIVRVPVHTVSEPNVRQCWQMKASRAKTQRGVVALAVRPHVRALPLPCVVTLTRIAPRKLDDDNLRGALKAVRDGVADVLGVNDRDPMVTWEYGQAKGVRGETAVEIVVARRRP